MVVLEVPEGVEHIEDFAYQYREDITEVRFPASIKSIGKVARVCNPLGHGPCCKGCLPRLPVGAAQRVHLATAWGACLTRTHTAASTWTHAGGALTPRPASAACHGRLGRACVRARVCVCL